MIIQERQPTPAIMEQFKQQSLELMGQRLAQGARPGYPELEDRFFCDDPSIDATKAILEPGTWWTGDRKEILQRDDLELHPWFDEMVRNRAIGAVAGLGEYWHRGNNRTADDIVRRHDLEEPHVLLTVRLDGSISAPGGFIDPGEEEIEAGIRECSEETTINLGDYPFEVRKVYQGVVADPRTTAHSWPNTSAFWFDLDKESTVGLPVGPLPSPDSGTQAYFWAPITSPPQEMFGSHKLLIDPRLMLGE